MKDRIFREGFFNISRTQLAKLFGLDSRARLQPLPVNFVKTIERNPDKLYLVIPEEGEAYVLHVEYQTTNDPLMHRRMLQYYLLIEEKYQAYPIKQFVLYTGARAMKMPDTFKKDSLSFSYTLIDMKSLSAEELLNAGSPESVVMAVLADYGSYSAEAIMSSVVQRLVELLKGKKAFDKYAFQLETLSELRNLKELAKEKLSAMPIPIDITKSFMYEKGYETAHTAVVKRMIAKGSLSDEEIAEFSGLSLSRIQEIKNQMEE